jgi:hypothetical protein
MILTKHKYPGLTSPSKGGYCMAGVQTISEKVQGKYATWEKKNNLLTEMTHQPHDIHMALRLAT